MDTRALFVSTPEGRGNNGDGGARGRASRRRPLVSEPLSRRKRFSRIFEKSNSDRFLRFFEAAATLNIFSKFSSAVVRGGDAVIVLRRVFWLPDPQGLPRI